MTNSYQLQRRIGHNSSRVTKGRKLFADPLADGRSTWARRWRDLCILHTADLGGFDMVSEAELSVCKRIATLETQLEKWEGSMSMGTPVDIELYGRIAGRLCRLLEMVGVKRVARATDPLGEFAAAVERYAQKPLDDDDGDERSDEDTELEIEKGLDDHEPGSA